MKHHAILEHHSIGTNPSAILHLLYTQGGVRPLDQVHADFMSSIDKIRYALVRVNGAPRGIHFSADMVAAFVRAKRRCLTISPETSVTVECNGSIVDIRTDRGRFLRPLFVVSNLYKLATIEATQVRWNQLLALGILEYVDKEEERNLVIAKDFSVLSEKREHPCTHMEIHGSVLYGVSASLIPFPDHNQAPRNTYQSQMGRQAQGMHSSNAKEHRMDVSVLELWYAQRPLVETQLSKILNCQNFPTGQSMMVAVLSAGSDGQEDAQIMNQSSEDRGLARSTAHRVVTISERRHGKMTALEEFANLDPKNCTGRKRGDYSKIENDGLVGPGAKVTNDTILVQKAIPIADPTSHAMGGNAAAATTKTKNASTHDGSDSDDSEAAATASTSNGNTHGGKPACQNRDTSVMLQNLESGVIQRVMVTSAYDNLKTAKIRYSKMCRPTKGDKFSTRHGQKGTLGALMRQEDLYWTEDGLCPDLIINAIAFTSRMTFGEFVETLLGIVCCLTGRFGDATPFSSCYRDALYKTMEDRLAHFRERTGPRRAVDEIADALRHLGLHPYGDRVMRSGSTGALLKGHIFMGMTYVQKLKHMVDDKLRARGRGRVQALTQQPVEGRSINGGLRFGEMERGTSCLFFFFFWWLALTFWFLFLCRLPGVARCLSQHSRPPQLQLGPHLHSRVPGLPQLGRVSRGDAARLVHFL